MLRFLLIVFVSLLSGQAYGEPLRIAAASDLRYVMPELVTAFEQTHTVEISVTYGASGKLAAQIQYGAPYHLFFSANPSYIKRLAENDLTQGEPFSYGHGALALFALKPTKINVALGLEGIRKALQANQLQRLAIANPAHAPYGQLAKAELEAAGLWQVVEERLLLADSAAQSMQFALTRNVDAALVPYSYMTKPEIARQGAYLKLTASVDQQAVKTTLAHPSRAMFWRFMQSCKAAAILRSHGFESSE